MANCEDEYQEEFDNIIREMKKKSDEYEKAHPGCAIKFVSWPTNYRALGWHPSWEWPAKGKNCPRCGGKTEESRLLANVRHNGDGCGTYVRSCNVCGLVDVSSYDEA